MSNEYCLCLKATEDQDSSESNFLKAIIFSEYHSQIRCTAVREPCYYYQSMLKWETYFGSAAKATDSYLG